MKNRILRKIRQKVDLAIFGSCCLSFGHIQRAYGSDFVVRKQKKKGLSRNIIPRMELHSIKEISSNEFEPVKSFYYISNRFFSTIIPNFLHTLLNYSNLSGLYRRFINWYATFSNTDKIALWGAVSMVTITAYGFEKYTLAISLIVIATIVFCDILRRK